MFRTGAVLRVMENTREMDVDDPENGPYRIVLDADASEYLLRDLELQAVRVAITFRGRKHLLPYPYTAEERRSKRLELIVSEEGEDLVPVIGDGKKLLRITEVRVTDNDRNTIGQGGRVVFVVQPEMWDGKIRPVQGVTALLVYRRDEPMEAWPLYWEERRDRRFEFTLVERPVVVERVSADPVLEVPTEEADLGPESLRPEPEIELLTEGSEQSGGNRNPLEGEGSDRDLDDELVLGTGSDDVLHRD
jgi:hypothetical protein